MHGDETRNGIKHRGLAAAIGAEQRHHTARGHLERHVGDADQVAVANLEVVDAEQVLVHVAGPPISSIGVWPAAALAARVPR